MTHDKNCRHPSHTPLPSPSKSRPLARKMFSVLSLFSCDCLFAMCPSDMRTPRAKRVPTPWSSIIESSLISAIAVPVRQSGWRARGIVLKPGTRTVELKRLGTADLLFARKEEAKASAVRLCKDWIDETYWKRTQEKGKN